MGGGEGGSVIVKSAFAGGAQEGSFEVQDSNGMTQVKAHQVSASKLLRRPLDLKLWIIQCVQAPLWCCELPYPEKRLL